MIWQSWLCWSPNTPSHLHSEFELLDLHLLLVAIDLETVDELLPVVDFAKDLVLLVVSSKVAYAILQVLNYHCRTEGGEWGRG